MGGLVVYIRSNSLNLDLFLSNGIVIDKPERARLDRDDDNWRRAFVYVGCVSYY